MSNILPQSNGYPAIFPKPFHYKLDESDVSSTHVSHMGLGGYYELPDVLFRNDIPIDINGLEADNMSSGRRKLGMIVYTQVENKFYQLIPLIGGNRITRADWDGFSIAQKLVALDPTKTIFDAEFTFEDVSGSGDPDDAWVELSIPQVPFGITGDGTIQKIFTLTQSAYDALVSAGAIDPITLYVIV